ncbi:hypothetical protein [Streptomyces sp. GC420]|uniref:hypothetical protein n=1 Tax=Streptomyces sp. GC420 TaxID=2697568 RepID=UPI001AA0F4FB
MTAVAERHRADHEVHHVATDPARWSGEHVRRLTDAAHAHGLDLSAGCSSGAPSAGVLPTLREKAADAPAHRPEPGLLLLRDLREMHLDATSNSLHWEMLAQAAQATKDDGLLAAVSACHPQTWRRMRWANAVIKVLSPQVLTSL